VIVTIAFILLANSTLDDSSLRKTELEAAKLRGLVEIEQCDKLTISHQPRRLSCPTCPKCRLYTTPSNEVLHPNAPNMQVTPPDSTHQRNLLISIPIISFVVGVAVGIAIGMAIHS